MSSKRSWSGFASLIRHTYLRPWWSARELLLSKNKLIKQFSCYLCILSFIWSHLSSSLCSIETFQLSSTGSNRPIPIGLLIRGYKQNKFPHTCSRYSPPLKYCPLMPAKNMLQSKNEGFFKSNEKCIRVGGWMDELPGGRAAAEAEVCCMMRQSSGRVRTTSGSESNIEFAYNLHVILLICRRPLVLVRLPLC